MTPDPIVLVAGLNQNCELIRAEDKVISVDMTGYDLAAATSLRWWLATSPYAVNSLIDKDLTAGIAVSGVKADITIAGTDTAAIAPEIYYQELRIVLADGSTKVAMSGNIVVRMSLNVEVTP
jgi:predicted metal-dependent phosphotriesterase family hydrolase